MIIYSYNIKQYDVKIWCFDIKNEINFHEKKISAPTVGPSQTLVKVKSSMARSLPVENLPPHNAGSIINYLQ